MKLIIKLSLIIIIKSLSIRAQNSNRMEETKIRQLIEKCYLNGALNEMNTDAMYEGYHSDFAIFFSDGEILKKLPLKVWVEMVKKYKNSDDNSGLRNFSYEFLQIDVNDSAAFVKLNLERGGELIFTDLITLLKFNGKWKIVTKIYHSYIENPWKI